MSRKLAGVIIAGVLATLVAASPAAAQGGQGGEGGGEGGGGFGRAGGMRGMGGRRMDPSQRFESMSSLDPVLKDIKLAKTQKDSIKAIEKAYKPQFEDLGKSARDMFQSGQRPDPGQMAQLRANADSLRTAEWADARLMLTTDQQTTFDKNVAAVQEQEQQRRQRMRERMGGAGGPP